MWAEGPGARLAAGVVALGLLTAACGSEPDQQSVDLPDADTSSQSSTASTAPSEDSGAPAGIPEPSAPPRNGDRVGDTDSRAYALQLPESGPRRQAAATLVEYVDARARAFTEVRVDLAEISGLSMGDALSAVQRYAADLEQRGHRVAGDVWFKLPPAAVTVRGKQATVAGPACLVNANAEVNKQGVAVESPPAAYRISASLAKAGPETWVVTEFSGEPASDC